MFKKLIISLLITLTGIFCKSQVTNLFGTIKNYKEVVELVQVDEALSFKGNNPSQIIYPNIQDNFNINLNITVPTYFLIGYNHIYLEPGDSLQVVIDMNDPKSALFTGKKSNEQEYLIDSPSPKSGSYLDGGRGIKKSHKETIELIVSTAKSRNKKLDNLPNTTETFIKLERGRIKADLLNSLEKMFSYSTHVNKIPKEKWAEEDSIINRLTYNLKKNISSNFLDSTLLQIPAYQNVVSLILNNNGRNTDHWRALKEFSEAKSISNKLANLKSTPNNNYLDSIKTEINNISNIKIKTALNSQLGKINNSGSIDYELLFKTIDEKTQKLSQFKDKPIYIDFWATWCAPCLEEREIYKKLAAEYKGEIIFLTISIDNDFNKWNDFVEKENNNDIINGWVNNFQVSHFNVVTIPRYILFNKNLEIIDSQAEGPSSKSLKKKLNQLIQQ